VVTKVFKITGNQKFDSEIIKQAAAILEKGGLVAFPTETVYGLGADALNISAVKKIYKAKQRPSSNPLICHVDSLEMAKKLAVRVPVVFNSLAAKFMPGPLTLLMEKSKAVPTIITAGASKVSVRIPNHKVALALIKALGRAIVAPSANISGRTSPTSAEHVLEDLDGRIDAIIDAGSTTVGVESTVLDITKVPAVIFRPGGVTKEQLEKVIGKVKLYKKTDTEITPSPGMSLKHYSSKSELILVKPDKKSLEAQVSKIKAAVGIMLPRGWDIKLPENSVVYNVGIWGNWKQVASKLFAGLRYLDSQNVNFIICPMPEDRGLGSALRDRLTRASYKDEK